MHYIIQENIFGEDHYDTLINIMNKYNFSYDIVKYAPIINEIVVAESEGDDIIYQTDKEKNFCFGAVALARSAKKYNWYPGSMLNENHDFEIYSEKYGKENMLNGDGDLNDISIVKSKLRNTKINKIID